MHKVILLLCFLISALTAQGECFLMNGTYPIGTSGYQNLVGLIMDEKISRHQLEDRLSSVEQAYAQIMKELQKDRNNRQQLIDENTKLNLKLTNVTADLNKLETKHAILNSEHDSLKADFDHLYVAHQKLEEYSSNWTIVEKLLEEKIQNMTTEQELLATKYHLLLEQYLTVTSHNQNTFVNNQLFTTEIQRLDNRLLNSEKNVSAQINQNREKIKHNAKQLGFSVKKVDKTSSANHFKFMTTIFNNDNMFNMSTGEFVCRHAGLYFIVATIVREPGVTQSYCFIYVNNSRKVGTVGYGSSTTGYASGTAATVHHLNVGDVVHLGDCHGIDHMHFTSSFSGFLIVQDQ